MFNENEADPGLYVDYFGNVFRLGKSVAAGVIWGIIIIII